MATIYDIDYDSQSEMLLPPDKRTPKHVAWIQSLVAPIQWVRDLFYDTYVDGFTGGKWGNLTSYSIGDRAWYDDRAVYQCIKATTPGIDPTDEEYWIKIQDMYIGLNERVKYNSGRLIFEYLLNKWFEVLPLPADQIYIENNFVDTNGFYLGHEDTFESGQLGTPNNQQQYLGPASAYDLNKNCFTIWVPTAIFFNLGSTNDEREKVVRAIADKYVISGMIYNVDTY